MSEAEAKKLLIESAGAEDPVYLPPSVLSKLSIEDLPEKTPIQVGVTKGEIIELDWEGALYRNRNQIIAEMEYVFTRKHWYAPVGLEYYLDLVRRAVEVRERTRGDVKLTAFDDDGAFVNLRFEIYTPEHNLGRAYEAARKVRGEVEEASERISEEIGHRLAALAARLSGWGSENLDALVNAVGHAKTTDDRGRSLEELCSRLFESVRGFTVNGRIRTATEEIDLSILNNSDDPRFRRESALLLAECKNWSGKCGKNEFVLFREKIENRNRRCNLGFLISWNGFATTVTKEMLRGSREELLIVPITGKHLRAAVREGDFLKVLTECWDTAVHL